MSRGLKTFLALIIFCVYFSAIGQAVPVDLSNFGADPSVTVTGEGTVTLVEDPNFVATYFYNDSFPVPVGANSFSFNYNFQKPTTSDNYFEFLVDNVSKLRLENSTDGTYSLALADYQGKEVSLAWGLIWGEINSSSYGAVATLTNLDISAIPIPEPSTILLLGSGLVLGLGLAWRKSKNRIKKL
jgi:hypothetical protein